MDKPAGPTSHDVVAMVRRAYHTRRVGHAGTLDPFATGVLVVLVGPPVRLARYLVGLPKRYSGVIRLGVTTTTGDPSGEILTTDESWRGQTDSQIVHAMTALCGVRDQRPPAYSAKHIDGDRAHRLARRGQPVELAPVRVEVRRFTLRDRHGSDLGFDAEVGSGTYLRSLAVELGEALGCGGHVLELRRRAVGPFSVEDAHALEAVRAGTAALLPAVAAVPHLPRLTIDDATVARVRHGQPPDLSGFPAEGPVALVSNGGLVAIAEPRAGRLQPRVVLPE